MHISLDSALGRQRRLNSVGESITQIAPDPAAAYSLRSLTGGDPKVVRVRRGSDNHEQDFTASEVSSGALTSFVNAQVTAPLDIQALTSTGRDGDFLIAKAAYSLRSLGTRQATVTSSGDTDGDTSGKFVCQVRRSSDDKIKSFTADEITDGTLLSFVGTSGSDNGFVKTWYDQSVTTQAGDTATGNHAVQATAANQPKIVNAGALVVDSGIGGLDFDGNNFLVAPSVSGLDSPFSMFSMSIRDATGYVGSFSKSTASNRYFGLQEASGTSIVVPRNATSGVSAAASVSGSERLTFAVTTGETSTSVGSKGGTLVNTTDDYGSNFTSVSGLDQLAIGILRTVSPTGYFNGRIREIIFYTSDQTDNRTAIEANMGEAYSIDLPSGVDPGFDQVDGFVETWYDQSGNGNDAVQATAGSQPKIVNAGSLLADGLTFDGSDDSMATTSAINSTNIAIACVSKSANNATAGIFSMLDGFNDGHEALYLAGEIRIATNSSDLDVSITTTNQNLYFANYDGSTQSLSSNGGTPSTKSTSQTISVSALAQIGSRRGGSFLNGSIEELIVYTSDQSSNRTALEANIISHYGIS